jgi:serine/threonine protein phosphatase 1
MINLGGKEMRAFVIGDLHGAYKALEQCLDRSGFDYENDVLIQLGDIADGYPEVYECQQSET